MALKIIPKEDILNHIGTKFDPSDWLTLDQSRINSFADCTEDHQFIHIGEEKAAQAPFGGTIAHGFLTLSMLARMTEGNGIVPEGVVMGVNYGFDKVRFLSPVRAGCRMAEYVRDHIMGLLEKFARDAKIVDIYEGTQQINQLIIARQVLGKSSRELK